MRTHKFQIIRLSLLLLAVTSFWILSSAMFGSRAMASNVVQSNTLVNVAIKPANIVNPRPLAAALAFDLCASDGTINLPGATVDVWGFVDTSGGSCTTGLINDTNFPGPVIQAVAGDTVTINLTNALGENVSILISGQSVVATGSATGTFTAEASANGGTASYSFTAQEGTYLYESGTNVSIQLAMGLYGALIVDSGVAGQAYGYAYDQDAVLLFSEIDPNLNADPGGFDLFDYHPTYWLINGKAHPNTGTINVSSGDQILLRYLNAGFDHPSMALLGAYQRVIAKDAFALPNTFLALAEIIPAGTTADMLVDTTGLTDTLPLYNRNMHVTNGDAFPGGMLTYISFGPPVDQPPSVNAGPDQTINILTSADLNGAVTDDGLSTLTTQWTKTSGPGTVSFGDDSLVDTTASFSVDGVYVLRLTATDGTVIPVFDEVTITAAVDQPPTVNAGVDQTVTIPSSANLDGTVTDDALSGLSTLWTTISGPGTVTFGNASLVDTTASFSAAGSYVLRLTATDGTVIPVFDEVTITVDPAPISTMHIGAISGSVANTSPGGPGGGTYTVIVTITAHNAGHSPLSGVTVSGTWSTTGGGFSVVSSSCVTNGVGQCTVQAVHNLNPNNASNNLTFTANSLTLASYTYVAGSNDVSNAVTVPRP